MPADLEHVDHCPVCRSDRQREVLEEPDYLFPTGVLRLVACSQCGLVFLNPHLTLEAIVQLEDASDAYETDAVDTEREIKARVELLRGLTRSSTETGRLLDVGCKRGLMLCAAQRVGWNPVGVEFSHVTAAKAREAARVPVYTDLAHVPRHGGFDLILAWHVLEHTTDPLSFLTHIRELLARQGSLALQVPSFSFADEFRKQGRLGSLVCAVHNLYFTERTLADTLRCAGLEPHTVVDSDADLMLTAFAVQGTHTPLTQPKASELVASSRSRRFEADPHDRFWWHKLPGTGYVPPIYGQLSDDEWAFLELWYEETARLGAIGEMNVPAMSLVQGLVMGNGLSRIVQLGHFYGYSALLLGFMLRAMKARPGVFSVDISEEATLFTQSWVDRAALGEYVHLHIGDSAEESSADAAERVLGGSPQLILLDASHEYEQTMRELEVWTARMPPESLMVLHDTSTLARAYDSTGAGGVQRALDEWLRQHPDVAFLNINRDVVAGIDAAGLAYRDGCGLGILQRRRAGGALAST